MKYSAVLFFIVLFWNLAYSGINETLPTYHIDYQYLQMLQDRGLCLSLTQLEKPYTRGEIARSLLEIPDTIRLTPEESEIISYLKNDFKQEIQFIEKNKTKNRLKFRSYLLGYLDKIQEKNPAYRGIYYLGGGIELGPYVYIANNYVSNQYDYYDPKYSGYKWRGISAYTDQAYINFAFNHFNLKLGRDYLRWGVGNSGALVLSDNTIPLDQLNFKINVGCFRFSFITSQLNSVHINDSTGTYTANRFLAAHRLGISLFNGRMQASVSELIIYGGPDSFFNLTYLNPFIFYHGAKKNGAPDNNVLPSIDILLYPKNNWQLYGSLLIDDIQLDKKVPGDLEPNEIGWLIGTKYADPFDLAGVTISTEYVRIANRTYKTPYPWERFTYKNRLLGYFLGNDLNYFQIQIDKWFNRKLFIRAKYSSLNKGEGNVFSPWDEPWMNYTVEQGYHEKSPSGIVESTHKIGFFIDYNPSPFLGFNAEFHYVSMKNFNHVKGATHKDFIWRLGIRLNFSYLRDFD